MGKIKFHIRVESTSHGDLNYFSFYDIEDFDRTGAEKQARGKFCSDFGGEFKNCKVGYVWENYHKQVKSLVILLVILLSFTGIKAQTDSTVITTGNYWRKGFAVLKDDTIKIAMLVTPDNVKTIYGYKIYKAPKFYKAIPYLEAPKYLDSNFHPLPTGFIVWDYTQIK